MLSITGPTSKQLIHIQNDKLLIIKGASWDDYWTLANEDLKVEFIKGLLYIQSPASLIHEEIFGYLLTEIRIFLKKHKVGRVLGSRFPITLARGDRAEPDILFLINEEVKKELSDTMYSGSPSLIIEIISPNYRDHDTKTKKEEYKEIGLKEYWIIDYEAKSFQIIRFQDKKIIFDKTFSKGIITPAITVLRDFTIDIEKFWKIIEESTK
jgi:Uma2 family endonuclease